jgi:hypothetical protein
VKETEIAALSIADEAVDALEIEILVAGFGAAANADSTEMTCKEARAIMEDVPSAKYRFITVKHLFEFEARQQPDPQILIVADPLI